MQGKTKDNFSIETLWLRKIVGVSRLQNVRNEKIRSSLNQAKTAREKTQVWFGLVWSCRMDGGQYYPAQNVILPHCRQQKHRKAKKNIIG